MVARAPKSDLVIPTLELQGRLFKELLEPFFEDRFDELHDEYLVEGPTGTGKSIGIGALYRYALRTFDGCNLLVMRQVKADLAGSFMQMWEEEILEEGDLADQWMLHGLTGKIPAHQSRSVYRYPNGSKLWCLGMNQWARFKSKAFDLIWPMEMTEFTEEQIEGLHTRLRARRKTPFPKRMLIGDVNPEYPEHWANQRALRGISHRIPTTLRDNPGYYDLRKREYTPEGNDYLLRLERSMRDPVRRSRYLDGVWTAASGQILKLDSARQVFTGKVEAVPGKGYRIAIEGKPHPVMGREVWLKGFGASFDWGSAHAGTLQVWGLDDKNRQYLVEEVYHSGKPHSWWADWALAFWEKYDLQFIACDSAGNGAHDIFNERIEAAAREKGHDPGKARIAVLCRKRQGSRQQSNLEVLVDLFEDQPDGKPAVYFRDLSLAHEPDYQLENKPKKVIEEIPQFLYAEKRAGADVRGRAPDRPQDNCVDDGLDACVYFRVHVQGGRRLVRQVPDAKKSSNVHDLMREHYWSDVA